MKRTFQSAAVAISTIACTAMLSLGWSEQGGLSLSVNKAEAQARVYIRSGYAASAAYVALPGLPWYAVRAYYLDGPWSGAGYSYTGWSDYAQRNGIGCAPGSIVKGGDGIMYNCQ